MRNGSRAGAFVKTHKTIGLYAEKLEVETHQYDTTSRNSLVGSNLLLPQEFSIVPACEFLKIKACDNLASLPLNRLVHSLSHLTIRACPMLKELCERGILEPGFSHTLRSH